MRERPDVPYSQKKLEDWSGDWTTSWTCAILRLPDAGHARKDVAVPTVIGDPRGRYGFLQCLRNGDERADESRLRRRAVRHSHRRVAAACRRACRDWTGHLEYGTGSERRPQADARSETRDCLGRLRDQLRRL